MPFCLLVHFKNGKFRGSEVNRQIAATRSYQASHPALGGGRVEHDCDRVTAAGAQKGFPAGLRFLQAMLYNE